MSDIARSVKENFFSILDFCYEMEPSYFNGPDRVEALWRTMIGNVNTSDGVGIYPASPDMAKYFHASILAPRQGN
jgi:hypothetical protein